MNWYQLIKFAQICNKKYDPNDLNEMLTTFYELEYIYSQLKLKPFTGHPKRKENIFNNVKKELIITISDIKSVLIRVFGNWLQSHALTNPEQWAISRLKENEWYNTEEKIKDALYEYKQYINIPDQIQESQYSDRYQTNLDNAIFREIHNHIIANENLYPTFYNLAKYMAEEYKNNELEELETNPEEVLNRYNVEIPEEAIKMIKENAVDTVIEIYMSDYQGFLNTLENNEEYLSGILTEINQNLIFPLWYAKWSAEGIDETRENMESVYNELIQSQNENIEQSIQAIHIALNTAHQTGSMLDNIEDEADKMAMMDGSVQRMESIPDLFNDLSNMDVSELDKELREIGVKI